MKRTALFVFVMFSILLVACSTPPTAAPTQPPAQPTKAAAQPTQAAAPATQAPTQAAAPATQAPSAAKATVPSKATGEPIKGAIIGPFTGSNAVLGEWQRKGYQLVFDEVNANGGIKGRPIALQLEDDEADPPKAVNLAQKVITQDKVVFAMATPNSTSTLAVVPIFAQYKVPHLTAAINLDITKKGSKYVIRTLSAGPAQEDTIVGAMVKLGYKKMAILGDNTAYGKGEGDYQEAALTRANLKAVARESHGADDKDFTGQLTKILQAQPEVLLLGSVEVPGGLIAKQARQLGFKGIIAGPGSIGTPKFAETAGEASEGVMFSSPFISAEVSEVAKSWAAKYKAKWGEDLEAHGANAVDGANLLVVAMNNASPNITGETIAAELHKIKDYQGVQGVFNVDETGETITIMQVGVIKGGKLLPFTGK